MDEASRTPEDLLAYLRVYLSEAHRHHPDQGCLLAAPNGEIAREEAVRPVATGHFATTLERMQRLLSWRLTGGIVEPAPRTLKATLHFKQPVLGID